MGNSYYEKTATNKDKFTKVKYFSDITQTRQLHRVVSCSSFLSINQMHEEYYEVKTRTTTMHIDLSTQIAFFVYNYANLRMLEFYYDFMTRFSNKRDFQCCEMDTDSSHRLLRRRLVDVDKTLSTRAILGASSIGSLQRHLWARRRLQLVSSWLLWETYQVWQTNTSSIPYRVGRSRHFGAMFKDLLL